MSLSAGHPPTITFSSRTVRRGLESGARGVPGSPVQPRDGLRVVGSSPPPEEVRRKDLYETPKGKAPPPLWVRGLLILTCTGVSFAQGGNDGQKGMGLIMLILIGAAPTAYALKRTAVGQR